MELTDESFVIRQYRSDDVEDLYAAARESTEQIYPWMEWCHPRFSRQDSKAWVLSREKDWKTGAEYSFVIADAFTKAFLGSCGINGVNRSHKFANLGYWVRTSATGRGAATAATKLLAKFGFQELKLNRIEIVISVGNRPSERVAEKVGATKEGILRRRLVIGNKTHDATMYSLIREDFYP
jgi:ribosomal-protein-serine acetyltransferase